jgi:hypothetical protein
VGRLTLARWMWTTSPRRTASSLPPQHHAALPSSPPRAPPPAAPAPARPPAPPSSRAPAPAPPPPAAPAVPPTNPCRWAAAATLLPRCLRQRTTAAPRQGRRVPRTHAVRLRANMSPASSPHHRTASVRDIVLSREGGVAAPSVACCAQEPTAVAPSPVVAWLPARSAASRFHYPDAAGSSHLPAKA